MERLAAGPSWWRDYAHTPDALERAIGALRPLTPGRLIVLSAAAAIAIVPAGDQGRLQAAMRTSRW